MKHALIAAALAGASLLAVPAVHWEWCGQRVMVMERMHGTPISQIDSLRAQGIDPSLLSAAAGRA